MPWVLEKIGSFILIELRVKKIKNTVNARFTQGLLQLLFTDMPTLPIPAGDFETFVFLPHDFQDLVETPDFLDIHTKSFKMTHNWYKFYT